MDKNDYNKQTYDRISFYVPKGAGAILTDIARQKGMSRNQYILSVIEHDLLYGEEVAENEP